MNCLTAVNKSYPVVGALLSVVLGGCSGSSSNAQDSDLASSAASCSNLALLQPGTQYQVVYQQNSDLVTHQDFEVIGYDDENRLITDASIDTLSEQGEVIATHSRRDYSIIFDDWMTSSTIYSENQSRTHSGGDYFSSGTAELDPYGFVYRFDLNEGESFNHSWTADNTHFDTHMNSTVYATHNYDVTLTYSGKEEVTVPAGTFMACRFDVVQTSTSVNNDPSTRESSHWLAEDLGILVKHSTGVHVIEIVSGSINGVDL